MAQMTITYDDFQSGDIILDTEIDQDFDDIKNTWNNHDSGSSTWTKVVIGGTGNSLVVDTNVLVADGTNDRVGIGTTTPATKLHVQDSSASAVEASIDNASTGDVQTSYKLNGTTTACAGIDNSVSGDPYVVSYSTALGTNNMIVGTAAGLSIKGTNTNDSATAGFVGEVVRSQVTFTNTPSTGAFGDLTSIQLTAGDWDICLLMEYDANGSTWSAAQMGISATSGDSTAGLTRGDNRILAAWANSSTTPLAWSGAIPCYRVQPTTTTTYYAKFSANFSAGQPQAACRMSARRAR